MLSIAEFLLVLAQLPLELVHATVDAGIRIAVIVMGDKHVLVLGIDDHFNPRRVLGVVEHHFDFLNPVVILRQLLRLLLA